MNKTSQQSEIAALTAIYNQGQFSIAIEKAEFLLQFHQNYLDIWNILGLSCIRIGENEKALLSFKKVVELNPDYTDAYNNIGYVLQLQGKFEEAIAAYERALAIKPDYAMAHNNLGYALQRQGRLDLAIAAYERALAIKPDYVEVLYNMGYALQGQGRLEEAIAAYERALAIKPDLAEVCSNLGYALQGQGRLEEAIAAYERALAIKPDLAEVHNNLGNALKDQGKLEEAIAAYERALAIKPDYAMAQNNLGIVLMDRGDLDLVIAAYERALAIKPDYAEAHNNLGYALQEKGKLDLAIVAYERALAIKPDYADAQWNLSLALILLGNYKKGWPLYESRITKKINNGKYYIFDKPLWQGEFIGKGTKMLICSEQGFGDFIQFCRYLVMLKDIGPELELIVEVPRPLLNIISSLDCTMTLVGKGDKLPEFDVYCHLMSLPLAFGTTVETIPNRTPYIYTDSNKLQTWRNKLGPQGRPRVGLVWSGSAKHSRDQNRSLKLDQLSNLISIHSIEWHSLQKEYREHDQYFLANAPEISQHQDALRDFSDTAALVECMDLIISVDTSVAHLAGALGKPVWILLPFAPDYRWLLDREDTPWYPTARLFRQSNIGEWQSVIDHVTSQVGQFYF